jgi:hypothetical protein
MVYAFVSDIPDGLSRGPSSPTAQAREAPPIPSVSVGVNSSNARADPPTAKVSAIAKRPAATATQDLERAGSTDGV